MSLYRYVQDRDELYDAVVERIVNELADDPEVELRPVGGRRPYLTWAWRTECVVTPVLTPMRSRWSPPGRLRLRG